MLNLYLKDGKRKQVTIKESCTNQKKRKLTLFEHVTKTETQKSRNNTIFKTIDLGEVVFTADLNEEVYWADTK